MKLIWVEPVIDQLWQCLDLLKSMNMQELKADDKTIIQLANQYHQVALNIESTLADISDQMETGPNFDDNSGCDCCGMNDQKHIMPDGDKLCEYCFAEETKKEGYE